MNPSTHDSHDPHDPIDALRRRPSTIGNRRRLTLALRCAPTLAALTISVALFGACGNSIYPYTSDSPTPTATITVSPVAGNFLYSSNFTDGRVAEFSRNLTTGVLAFIGSVAAGAANGPVGIATGLAAKYIYAVNSADGKVHQYTINQNTGGLSSIGTGTIAAGSSPQWIALTPNAQFAYVTNSGDGTVSPYTVNTTTGALSTNGNAISSALLKKPTTAVASSTFLYVTDDTKSSIVSFPINADGTLGVGTSTALPAGASPGPVVIDPTGSFVYVTDQARGVVYFLTIGTSSLTLSNSYTATTAGSAGLAFAQTGGNTYLYVANPTAVPATLTGFFVNGDGTLNLLSGTPYADPSLSQPTGVVVDPTGTNLYVANQGNGTISQFLISSVDGSLGIGVPVATESITSGPLYLQLAD